MRTTTFKKRTLVAYAGDESSDELVVTILGVFHGGQDWAASLGEDQGDPGGGPMTYSCVANAWQEDRRRPSAINLHQRVCAGQPHNANDDRQHPLSVPRFPWYY